jgi:hypothetical protein
MGRQLIWLHWVGGNQQPATLLKAWKYQRGNQKRKPNG